MKELKKITNSTEETHQLGNVIGQNVSKNMVILLDGDLGAGKTTLTQGIAKGLGIKRNVTSPTFTIQKIYHGEKMNLYHIDAYRMEGMRNIIICHCQNRYLCNGAVYPSYHTGSFIK